MPRGRDGLYDHQRIDLDQILWEMWTDFGHPGDRIVRTITLRKGIDYHEVPPDPKKQIS